MATEIEMSAVAKMLGKLVTVFEAEAEPGMHIVLIVQDADVTAAFGDTPVADCIELMAQAATQMVKDPDGTHKG